MANHANGHGCVPDPQRIAAEIDALHRNLSSPLDPNDLGRLAQMHTGCLALAACGGSAARLAAAVAGLLEAVILKEAADAPAGLALVSEAVGVIERAIEGQDVEPESLIARVTAAAKTGPPPDSGPDATGTPDAGAATTPPRRTAAAFATRAPEGFAPAPALPSADPTPLPASWPSAGSHEPGASEPLIVDLSERDHLDGFVSEAREHMDAIEAALLEVEQDPTNTARIDELFRPFHTIKGIAGFLNLRDINRLTHELESILDLGRKNQLPITPDTIDLFFAGADVLKQQIDELAGYLADPSGEAVPQPDITDIISRLQARASAPPPTPAAAPACEPLHHGGEIGNDAAGETSIRVDTTKLDFLVDAVGELVIAQTMVNTNKTVATSEKLCRDVSQVTKIVRDVQEIAMAMRMVPIGNTFRKMRRVARDVARKAGKQVELQISGEETELDKNVIQAISDPLVHLVRNAVDHGIESPPDRRAAGKPETGTVWLHAFHQGDSIVIEVRDDGKGLDRDRLIAKAIEHGLITSSERLTDQQILALIMHAGLSTATQITDVSGRGVGMDVVRRNVEQLRGKIDIASQPGQGSVFSIRLPLTLAIIDGMLVGLGNERLIIPTILIEQSLRPAPHQLTVVQRNGTMIQVRGELIPLVQLGPIFGMCGPVDPTRGLVVIAQTESHKIGIVVDQLIGQQQVVIKTLGARFKHVRGISGAAILGDGQVGLILDPTGLLRLHNASRSAPPRPAGFRAAADDPNRLTEPKHLHPPKESDTPAPAKPAAATVSGGTCT